MLNEAECSDAEFTHRCERNPSGSVSKNGHMSGEAVERIYAQNSDGMGTCPEDREKFEDSAMTGSKFDNFCILSLYSPVV